MNGPSKEELALYWRSNRTHFESLAKYYLEKDKNYYDEFIAPFYKSEIPANPYSSYSEQPQTNFQTRKRSGSALVVIVLVVLALGIAGVAFFFTFSAKVEKQIDKFIQENTFIPDTSLNRYDDYSTDDPFIKGLEYVGKKDYENAEYYLKQVPEGDPDYTSAKQMLESIKYLKKYNGKGSKKLTD